MLDEFLGRVVRLEPELRLEFPEGGQFLVLPLLKDFLPEVVQNLVGNAHGVQPRQDEAHEIVNRLLELGCADCGAEVRKVVDGLNRKWVRRLAGRLDRLAVASEREARLEGAVPGCRQLVRHPPPNTGNAAVRRRFPPEPPPGRCQPDRQRVHRQPHAVVDGLRPVVLGARRDVVPDAYLEEGRSLPDLRRAVLGGPGGSLTGLAGGWLMGC